MIVIEKMEIEKKRETSWKIQLKKSNESIEMTSVEISGEVRLIKLSLLNKEKIIKVEMNKGEFFNFLSLLSAFRLSLTNKMFLIQFSDYKKLTNLLKIIPATPKIHPTYPSVKNQLYVRFLKTLNAFHLVYPSK